MVALNALNILPLWLLAIPTNTGIFSLRLAMHPATTSRYRVVALEHTHQPLMGVSPSQAVATDTQIEVDSTQDQRGSDAKSCTAVQTTSSGSLPPTPRKTRTKTTEFQCFLGRQREGRANEHVVLDLRPIADFQREHLVGATSIPAVELEARMLELPPPFGCPVSVVGSDEVTIL